jgi:hypothetical protein
VKVVEVFVCGKETGAGCVCGSRNPQVVVTHRDTSVTRVGADASVRLNNACVVQGYRYKSSQQIPHPGAPLRTPGELQCQRFDLAFSNHTNDRTSGLEAECIRGLDTARQRAVPDLVDQDVGVRQIYQWACIH